MSIKAQIQDLHQQIVDLNNDQAQSSPLTDYCNQNAGDVPNFQNQFRYKRTLRGHFGKIYAMHWSQDSRHLVSASQDGKLIIWNAFSTNKIHAIHLKSSWVMTCAYSNTLQSPLVACGGLDNLCSIYHSSSEVSPNQPGANQKPIAELSQHEGYLSCCRFVGPTNEEIITSSGDSTCILWDVDKKTPKAVFSDHQGDVMSVSVCEDTDKFVSGSTDATAKYWDYREKHCSGCAITFSGHDSDINYVQFFPDKEAFGTGSDDSTMRLYDTRSKRQLSMYSDSQILIGITSIAFSKSGYWIFGGYDDFRVYYWNVLTQEHLPEMNGHDNRVSCLGVSADGQALCTGSWDTLLRVWA